MKDIFECIRRHSEASSLWLDRLVAVFTAMDAGYGKAAGDYGFVCSGCEDNCCRSRFYHHTLLEYMAIYKGYSRLAKQERQPVEARAGDFCRQHAEADAAGTVVKAWCPLNREGCCLVYDLRPMICRLHGIPHVLQQTAGRTVQGPGCEYFRYHHAADNHAPLDRTPFYIAMAGLEKEFRAALDVKTKFKQTIAEMILSFLPESSEEDIGDNR